MSNPYFEGGRRRFPLLAHTVRHRFIVWYTVRIDSSCIRRGPHRKRRATKCGPPCKQGATNTACKKRQYDTARNTLVECPCAAPGQKAKLNILEI